MALSKTALSSSIQAYINGLNTAKPKADAVKDFADGLADCIVSHLLSNLSITVPSASVIIAVAGNAVGTPNPAPIACGVL